MIILVTIGATITIILETLGEIITVAGEMIIALVVVCKMIQKNHSIMGTNRIAKMNRKVPMIKFRLELKRVIQMNKASKLYDPNELLNIDGQKFND